MFGRDKEKAAPQQQAAASTAASTTYGATAQSRASSSTEGQMPKIETVVGANCRFSGTLQSDGGVRVDGILEGNLHTTGNVIVAESATVVAEISAYNVTISGAVKGNVTANKVEITETGRLWGDLNVNAILLHEGAYLEGQTNMANAVAPPTLEPTRQNRAPQLGAPARDGNRPSVARDEAS